jgi:hypothetical protein
VSFLNLAPRTRAAVYIALLVGLNVYFVQNLFSVDFTNNMQTNAGTFMAISRYIVAQWPHLNWYPWWFNGEPFENTYSPMLHLMDAAFAGIFHCSTARAFNFVTGVFYVTGPAFLFLFAWRVSKFLETSFFAALLYSLFSPAAIFDMFRSDIGNSWWNSWRCRVLVYYGEGPHTTALAMLPLALLFTYLALTRKRYGWYVAAGFSMAFVTLVNAFGAVDLGIGCACLILAMRGGREMWRAALTTAGIALFAYLLACDFLTPTLVRTIMTDSQNVGDHYGAAKLLTAQWLMLPAMVCLWFAIERVRDYFSRFSLLFAFVFFEIVALFAVAHVAVLPQPHRYSLEMEPALALVVAFSLRPAVRFLKPWARAAALVLVVALAWHQMIHFRRYGRFYTQKLDVTSTIEYKTAQWFQYNLAKGRAFVGAETGLWLNVFADTSQMNSGHEPFNPNFAVVEMSVYSIYSGENAGTRDAENSILWLKAFGCQAIYIPGPKSRVNTKPFQHPYKFEGVLPVLWHEEDDTIYAVPQRTKSLAHVMAEGALVQTQPINGLDTGELSRYVAALDDPAFPDAPLIWRSTTDAQIRTTLHPGQVISVQQTFDKGWIATANGRPAKITRDALGMTVIHAACDGDCEVRFTFDGGLERKLCRAASWTAAIGALAGFWIARRRRKLY